MRAAYLPITLLFFACDCGDEPTASIPSDAGTVTGPGATCAAAGAACGDGIASCCSGVCGPNGQCTSPTFCKGPNEPCTSATECCTLSCENNVCSTQLCLAVGQGCGENEDCCSSICDNGVCAEVPAGPGGDTCLTLGERCQDPSTCCSTNCQGGVCVRAYSCQANGDVCHEDVECCGNVCSATSGEPGRCQQITGGGAGGCIQGGNPCSGGTNCCSRICVDLGSGASVCQVAGGCRLTGDWCENDEQCCGGGSNPNGTVECHDAPNGRCDNGQSCNPVGNICGAPVLLDGGSINASQNCCDGKKEVCKLDSVGIPRCYGGCPNDNCTQDCPNGYDPYDPNCCIEPGDPCQFRDQCCGAIPCVPAGPDGGLICAVPSGCLPLGETCDPNADAGSVACCLGTVCGPTAQPGVFVCRTPYDGGLDPLFDGGSTPGPDTGADAGTPPACLPNGTQCNANADCCSELCEGGVCAAPSCQPQGEVCTADGDCCAGLSCRIQPGSVSGTCEPGATCGSAGQTCSATQTCCDGLICTNAGELTPCDGNGACVCNVIL